MILYSSKALLFISRQWRRIFFARSTGLPFHRFQPHLVGKGFFAWQYLRPLKIAFDHKNGSGVTVKVYDLELIDDFPGHPFKVRDDEDMIQLVESVKERGVITPATVRPKEDVRYELVSG